MWERTGLKFQPGLSEKAQKEGNGENKQPGSFTMVAGTRRGNGGLAIQLGLREGHRPGGVMGICFYFVEQMKQRRTGRG